MGVHPRRWWSGPLHVERFAWEAMGKRSVALDLRRSGARLDALLASADVVLLGYRPGALARVGLDPVALRERHPDLVVAALSAWGEAGPWGRRPGFDSIVQATCGIADACGEDGRPGALPVQALDHASGYAMAARVITLLARGRGGLVRVSLLGAARTLLDLDDPPPEAPADLDVPTVLVPGPGGELEAVPPPVRLDGATIERPVTGYAAAAAEWLPGARR